MVIARNLEGLKNHGQLFYPKNKDTLAIQNMNNTRQAVETVNFRDRKSNTIQNQTESNTILYIQHMYRARERKQSVTRSERLSKTVEIYLHDGITLYIQSNKQMNRLFIFEYKSISIM